MTKAILFSFLLLPTACVSSPQCFPPAPSSSTLTSYHLERAKLSSVSVDTFFIETDKEGKQQVRRRTSGSGTLLDSPSGPIVLTVNHLLNGPAGIAPIIFITYVYPDLAEPRYFMATPLRRQEELDLATLLLLSATGEGPTKILPSGCAATTTDYRKGEPIRGAPVWVLASSFLGETYLQAPVYSTTIVAALWGSETSSPYLLLDYPVADGNSGGGIFSQRTGRLIGVVQNKLEEEDNEQLHVYALGIFLTKEIQETMGLH